ncbi:MULTISPECIES: phosphatase PAP2 family protein [unclassified Streptomyces]|uniref:phosphatase PAP2 family protein n=1 Tax=unclassified Streptomyces TaxID=2593676 RepID=UPI002E7FF064|nr:phosphatase PAP2 family protein [Streptomyces sp. NBC_00589]WTI42964.1 phosphatase PAP2 family protein [Streptomyces sp. NBC_00775]WUB32820.1 phosphatase PAP2 family protein [Streptomyces sp. NBC_00589]
MNSNRDLGGNPSAEPRRSVPAAPPRGALAAGSILLLTTFVMGLLLRGGQRPFFQGADERLTAGMAGSTRGSTMELALFLDRVGGPMGVVIPLAVTGCLGVYGRWRSALFFFATSVLANLVVVLPLKAFVGRARPPHPWVLVSDGSFPSGQVFMMTTLLVAVGVVFLRPRTRLWGWIAFGLLVALMMWSRVWLHAQWLSDALAGAMAGAGAGLVLWRAFAALLRCEAERLAADRLWG